MMEEDCGRCNDLADDLCNAEGRADQAEQRVKELEDILSDIEEAIKWLRGYIEDIGKALRLV